jgi:TonB family protein
MSCPDPYRPFDPQEEAASLDAELKVQNLPSDSEVRALTNALVAGGGGPSSPDLALDLVLNQIVEQACLATGATGAAIALTRDGEMVCRATTGRNAPDLGVRLDNAGFSAECLRVGTLQRCDDTETDPRVDAMACRLLGVRSILVIPLWYWGEFMGIFEIFSPRPNAFGERDEQTLQALAYRVVRHTKQATGSIAGFTANMEELPKPAPVLVSPAPEPELTSESEPEPESEPVVHRADVLSMPVFELNSELNSADEDRIPETPLKPQDKWTAVLAAVAVVIAGLIVGLMIWRVGWGGTPPRQATANPGTVRENAQGPVRPVADTLPSAPHEEILEFGAPPMKEKGSSGGVAVMAAKKQVLVSAGQTGLAIYEKGKLIYGSPVANPDQLVTKAPLPKAQDALGEGAQPVPTNLATRPLPTPRIVQLSPEIADGLLLDRVEPEYPDAARRARVQGSVTIDVLIGTDGRVLEANMVGGNPQLADAAAAAVRKWRYKPYSVNGQKVSVRTQVPVTFMLAE